VTPFVKSRAVPLAGEYATEAAGLRWLGEAGVPVPEVLEVGDDRLVLARIAAGPTDAEELGRTVARLHLAGAPAFGGLPPGAPGPYRIADVEFPAGASGDWPAFYAEHRLLPLARHAPSVAAVCERIADLAGPLEKPARLHGDLWGGNIVGNHLIDPCACGGHREVDLAMLRLFGWAGRDRIRFLAAYQEVAPLAEGWQDRVDLYQLLPLLVHAELFGGGYGEAAERAARRYARG
jgi:fructosamine-3-kinase